MSRYLIVGLVSALSIAGIVATIIAYYQIKSNE
jgi:hypothetical protein